MNPHQIVTMAFREAVKSNCSAIDAASYIMTKLLQAGYEIVPAKASEVVRLRDICYDIADICNTDSRLYQEPVDYFGVINAINELAGKGY